MKDKKSPLKFKGLAAGAYEAAAVHGAKDITASKTITGIADMVAQTGLAVTQYFGEIGKQYDEFAENVLNNGVTLSDENFEALYNDLQDGRSSFITGNKKNRTLAMKNLNQLANSYEDYKDLVENTAILANDPDGLLDTFKNSPEGKAYLDAMSGKNKLTKNPNKDAQNPNDLGVIMNDRWTSLNDLKRIAEANTKDTNFASTIEALAVKQLQSKVKPDMKAINYTVSRMIKNGKTNSLIYSEIIPGRTFYDDVATKLENKKLSDLGLNSAQLNRYPTSSGLSTADVNDGIDSNEARRIADVMIKDTAYNNQLNEELNEYYSTYVAQQNALYGKTDFPFTPTPWQLSEANVSKTAAQKRYDETIEKINNSNLSPEEKDKKIQEANNMYNAIYGDIDAKIEIYEDARGAAYSKLQEAIERIKNSNLKRGQRREEQKDLQNVFDENFPTADGSHIDEDTDLSDYLIF